MIWEAWDGIDDSWSFDLCQAFLSDPKRTLTRDIRSALAEDSWTFGHTIFTILHCPCCASNEMDRNSGCEADDQARKGFPGAPARVEAYLMLEEMLGDDHDGLISTLNDFDALSLFRPGKG